MKNIKHTYLYRYCKSHSFYTATCVGIFALTILLPCITLSGQYLSQYMSELINWFTVIGFITVLILTKSTKVITSSIGILTRKLSAITDIWFLLISATTFLTITCVLSDVLFSHLPHVADSQAQYIQSKIFASGMITAPEHPWQVFFNTQFMVSGQGKYYSVYPPGHAVLLAIGQLLGKPWIINPTLGALSLIAVYFLCRELAAPATARLSAILFMLSPFVVFMSSEYMNHATALLLLTLFVLFYIRILKYQKKLDALYIGLCTGCLILTRPQVLVAVGIFFIFHILYLLLKEPRTYFRLLSIGSAGILPFIAIQLYYNQQTIGGSFQSAYTAFFNNDVNSVTWAFKLAHLLENLEIERLLGLLNRQFSRLGIQVGTLNRELFCWPILALPLILCLFLFKAEKSYSWILAGVFFATCLWLFITYPNWNNLFGPRYFYETSGVLVIMFAMAIHRIPLVLRKVFSIRVTLSSWRGMSYIALVILCILGLQEQTKKLYTRYSSNYWEGNATYSQIASAVEKPAIIFNSPKQFRYVSFHMPQSDSAPVIYANDLNEQNKILMNYYPDRNAYRIHDKFHPYWVQKIQ